MSGASFDSIIRKYVVSNFRFWEKKTFDEPSENVYFSAGYHANLLNLVRSGKSLKSRRE
jgi:hypothetical protein